VQSAIYRPLSDVRPGRHWSGVTYTYFGTAFIIRTGSTRDSSSRTRALFSALELLKLDTLDPHTSELP